jgi:cyclopropane-fatty-acyl-phospholipid synthase
LGTVLSQSEVIMSSKFKVEQFLDLAGVDKGIFTAGDKFYSQFNKLFTLGWGNAYIQGQFYIDDEALIHMFTKVFRAFSSCLQGDDYAGFKTLNFHNLYQLMKATQVVNWQFIRPRYFADKHYELPPELFEGMLDDPMNYSSGYWPKGITAHNESQAAKLALVVRKTSLQAGDTVLDFGCGFGSSGQYAGELGIRYVGLNICKQHLKYAHDHNTYPNLVTYLDFNLVTQSVAELRDILKLHGITEFDAATFIGSIEHVGWKNYTNLYRKLYQLLKPEGQILCHTIGSYLRIPCLDPYITKYIFPDGQLPTVESMTKATEAAGFQLMDWHNLETGIHSYSKTLRCWLANFKENWKTIKPFMPHKDKEKFYREWVFYLMLCIGAFEAKNFINIGHYVFRKIDNSNPFTVVR